jgi:hypothetical protein
MTKHRIFVDLGLLRYPPHTASMKTCRENSWTAAVRMRSRTNDSFAGNTLKVLSESKHEERKDCIETKSA